MKIPVTDIPEEGLQLRLHGDKAVLADAVELIPPPEEVSVSPYVTGELSVFKSDGDFIITGEVSAEQTLQCARCLKQFRRTITLPLDFTVRPVAQDISPEQRMEELEEVDAVCVEEGEIDVGELMLQEVYLSIPMKPLCNEDCPGLCSRCGNLKGSEQCTCPEEKEIDPRWEALQKLKEQVSD